jgi:hypothetical protein
MSQAPHRYTAEPLRNAGASVILTSKDGTSFVHFIIVVLAEMFHRYHVIEQLSGIGNGSRRIWFDRSQVSLLNCFFSSPSIVNQLLLL